MLSRITKMVLLLKETSKIIVTFSALLIPGFMILLMSSNSLANITGPAAAQTLETPSSSPGATGPGPGPTIQITSHQDGQQVPPGELTIQGTSSDDEETDCQVYADVNDVIPMRNATATGDSGEEEDFSKWTFTYTQEYHLITQGENELTAKITCVNDGESDLNPFPAGVGAGSVPPSSPLSEWHTVNVTGVTGAAAVPSPSLTLNNAEEIDEGPDEASNDEEEESGEESTDDSDDGDSSEDSIFG
ncbi:MAG TPA: hypothetical protein VE573_07325 [Nitrososphaeraceae archaeon]|jgi:hypothetical protein|nr:hypothetical protein [Nitrososphaeraceae archaeon]